MPCRNTHLRYMEANEVAGEETINPITRFLRNIRSKSDVLLLNPNPEGGMDIVLDEAALHQRTLELGGGGTSGPKGEWAVKLEGGQITAYNSLSPEETEGHVTVDRQYAVEYASFTAGTSGYLYIRVEWDSDSNAYAASLHYGSSMTGTWTYQLARVRRSTLSVNHTPGNVIAVTGRYV